MNQLPLCAVILALLASGAVAKPASRARETDWRAIATPADKMRLHDWRATFVRALGNARTLGQGDAVAREGKLLNPDAALVAPALQPGNYNCRLVKVGSRGSYASPFSARPVARCVIGIGAGYLTLTTPNGLQRANGNIYPNSDRRQIFLGTVALGDETRTLAYGIDATRNMAGALERIELRRWRILLPDPAFESILDVIELTPAE